MKRTIRLLLVLLALVLWLLPGTAAAVDFCEDVSKYTFDYFAPATIRFTMPVYEKDGIDSWVYDGNVYAQAEGEVKMKVFHWETVSKDINGDATTMTVLMSRNINDDGTFVYKRRDGNNYPVGYNSSSFEVQIIPSTDNFEVVVEWTVPYSLRGKRVEMSFESKVDFNSSIYAKTTLSGIPKKTFSISAAPELTEPQVMEPVLAYEKGRAGQVMVPWVISTNKVTNATAHWYNEQTGKDESQTLDAKSSGFVYLDAFTPLSKFYVEAKYMNSENREVGPVKSTPEITIPMLHRPRNATTDINAQGNIVVSWGVESKDHADITKSDYFEVQRNTSGNSDADDPGWRSVGVFDYVDGQETYSFTDDIFLQNYQNRAVCYRIRRASVATWGWKGEVGAAETSTTKMFMLPSVNTATITKAADWGKDNLHNATLQFTLGRPRLDFVSKDLDGRVVCQLRTAADWDSLAVQVAKGETVLAMMMADIDLGDRQTMLGTADTPFRGVFNGLGHTLTVHYHANRPNAAPISAAQEAIISNVHVEGTIASSQKFNAGLVGLMTEGSDVVMENCWVSATVASSINGDATMGGVVGHTADGAKLRITNTLFDGTLEGANSIGIGGIIGWVERNGKVTLDRVTFAPTAVTTQNDGSTFARCRDEANTLTITHCKTTYILGNLNRGDITIPDILLRTAADWEQLCKVVAEGRNVDVYMLSDINLGNSTLMLGEESHPFTGAFHGQGHTLTVAYSANEVSILYPTYSSGSRYNGTSHRAPWHNASGTSMTMVAVAEGVETQPGDMLTVWCGAERCGVAVADDEGLFWVSIGDTESVTKALTFTLERDGEVVAVTTRSHLSYQANATLGTPDTPTAISFVDFHPMPNDDNWYTLSGIQLQKKPERAGMYIHDNQVKMVK